MITTPRRYLLPMWDGGGTVAPGLGVARRLLARGHAVHVLADPTIEDQAIATGCTFSPWTSAPHRTTLDPDQDLMRDWETTNPLVMLRLRPRSLHGRAGRAVRRRHRRSHRPRAARRRRARLPDLRRHHGGPGGRRAGGADRAQHLDPAEPGVPAIGPGFPLAKGRPGRCARRRPADGRQRPVPARPAAAQRAQHARGLPPLRSFYDQVLGTPRILVLASPGFDFASPSVPANVTYTGAILDEPTWAEPWTDDVRSDRGRPARARRLQHDLPGAGAAAAAGRRRLVVAARARHRHPRPDARARRRLGVGQRHRRAVGAARPDPRPRRGGDHPLRPRHRHEGARRRRPDGVHPDGPRPERHRRSRGPPRRRRPAVTEGVRRADRGRRARRARRPQVPRRNSNKCGRRRRRRGLRNSTRGSLSTSSTPSAR